MPRRRQSTRSCARKIAHSARWLKLIIYMDINRLRPGPARARGPAKRWMAPTSSSGVRCFLAAGQSQEESPPDPTCRPRGADLRGVRRSPSDAAYLTATGVYTLLRIVIRDNRPELVGHLFAGRLSLGDTVRLAPLFDSGWPTWAPVHLPAWASDLRLLAANLAFSAFITRIQLDVLDLEVLMAFADEHETDAAVAPGRVNVNKWQIFFASLRLVSGVEVRT